MTRAKTRGAGASHGPDPIYLALRNRLLSTSPAALGIEPTDRLPRAWAVLADLPAGDGMVTVVVVADGTTSLYTSRGGGIIGAGSRPEVAAASANLLATCEGALDGLPQAAAVSLPPPGHVAWTVLARDGNHRLEALEAEAEAEATAGGPGVAGSLFVATHAVITALRLAEVKRR
jgi:hypothetical protein